MNKQETAQNLRKVANFMKGLIQAADDIEAIGSMEGATAEAIRARDAAVAERETALAELADAKASGKKAVAAAKERAEALLADAQAKADALVAEATELAKKEAAKIVNQAALDAESAEKASRARVEMLEARIPDLVGQDAAAGLALAEKEIQLNAAKTEYEKLTKALDKIKAQFKIGD